jgi:hypothetical protein
MALQLLPVFFREFLGDKSAAVIYTYPKSSITLISFDGGFDFRLYGQYDHIFAQTESGVPNPPQSQPKIENPSVIKLFDD